MINKVYVMYVLALSDFFKIRAEARLLAGYKPAPRVDDKLQFIYFVINPFTLLHFFSFPFSV